MRAIFSGRLAACHYLVAGQPLAGYALTLAQPSDAGYIARPSQ